MSLARVDPPRADIVLARLVELCEQPWIDAVRMNATYNTLWEAAQARARQGAP